ncbi:MAG: hypothetical protein WA817_16500 [Candidatus Acidiferrum sp.]
MPASKRRPNGYALFIPLQTSTVEAYQKQRDRLELLMGPDLARYFSYTDPTPSTPNQEPLNASHEAKELHGFMLRNQLSLQEMRAWILASQEEERLIEQWCCGDFALLDLSSRMLDFRREVWGEFLLLLEKQKGYRDERKEFRNEQLDAGQHHGTVCV